MRESQYFFMGCSAVFSFDEIMDYESLIFWRVLMFGYRD